MKPEHTLSAEISTQDQFDQAIGLLEFSQEIIAQVPEKTLFTVLTHTKNNNCPMVDPKHLHAHPGFNPRIKNADYYAHIRRLADSIKANGFYLDKPFAVVTGKKNGRNVLYVTEGGCRLEALKIALEEGAPIDWVPAAIKPRSTSMEDLTVALVKGNEGKPFSPLELAINVARLDRFGWSVERIARELSYTETYVTQLLTLASAPASIRALIETGEVPAAVAMETLRQHGEDAKEVLDKALDAVKSKGGHGITRKHLPAQVYKRTVQKTAPALIDAVSEMRQHEAFKQFPRDLQERVLEMMSTIDQARAELPATDKSDGNPDQMDLLDDTPSDANA